MDIILNMDALQQFYILNHSKMKTILVLTDLSKKAENASLYALKLAENLRANIILYHCFKVFRSVVLPETGMWPMDGYEDIKNESLVELKKLGDRLAKHHQHGNFKPMIQICNDMGDLGSNVHQLAEEKNIDLIVMGAKSDDIVSHILYGSETNAVLEEVKCPILFIPDQCSFINLKTIVFSVDLKKYYPKAVGFLIDIARIHQSQIITLHIGTNSDINPSQFVNMIQNVFEYTHVASKQIPGEDVGEKLEEFLLLAHPDLTVMVHHQRSIFGEFIPGSNSKKMLYRHKTPLLILRD
ncbi:UspA domain-containing protein [Mucilaginibacter paludis DSM 18603]|uniref:UspA domain-containing protein n=2 Tax=Mucilaginibacter TaxID=423349 RepID=H1YD67_9SPHI|nr:UspA domain-containing protein [Mucilaginibacter paludis DSM 18603]